MIKQKLTKERLKNFSISYSKAKSLGITDEDLMYIYEIGKDKYRISIRYNNDRITKVVYGLLNAINEKWNIIKKLENDDNDTENYVEEQKQIIKKQEDKKDGEDVDSITVREGFDKFFEYRKNLIDKKIELTTYEKDLVIYRGRYVRNTKLLDMKIIEVTEEEAQDYVEELFSLKPLKGDDERLSETTLNNPYSLFHLAFEYFKNKLKIIKSNPFDLVDTKPKYKPKKRNYLANVDIQYVLDKVEERNIRFKTLVNLFLETGLRIEEIVAIKFSDINRRRMTIKIVRAVIKSKITGDLIIKDLKTDDSEREISISHYSLELIDNYRKFREQMGIKVSNDDFIFVSWEDNELINPDRFTKEWKKFILALGYKDLPLRIIRHSAATFMLQGETNLEAVKRRFGWSKLSTVMGIYQQSNLEEDRKLLEKFDDEFRNTLGISYADLYKICVNRFNNKRKLNNVMQKILVKAIDEIELPNDLIRCQNYLYELFPVFKKISKIDSELDDEEIEAIFVGFKNIYKKIKIQSIDYL